eukprot:TsM_000408200 transcript=TsM_000408200 gene=TsM_000408200
MHSILSVCSFPRLVKLRRIPQHLASAVATPTPASTCAFTSFVHCPPNSPSYPKLSFSLCSDVCLWCDVPREL